MSFHSWYAKRRMRRQVNGWINQCQKTINSRRKELRYFTRLAPLTKSDWDDNMIPILKEQLKKVEKQLLYYNKVKVAYKKNGLI